MAGECHANKATDDQMAQKYALHVERFHQPGIRPPRMCGALNLTQAEASSYSWMMAPDLHRVGGAETAPRQEENKLSRNKATAAVVAKHLQSDAPRGDQEQQLAAEFKRLKQDYDLLQTEESCLKGGKKARAAKLSRSSESGKLK